MGRIAGGGKVAYIWISPDPTKAGPTLGVVVIVVLNNQENLSLSKVINPRSFIWRGIYKFEQITIFTPNHTNGCNLEMIIFFKKKL